MFFRSISVAAFCALVLGLSAAVLSAEAGRLSGRFVVEGDPPAVPELNLPNPVFGSRKLADESLLVDPRGGIANVVVYVRTPDLPVPDAAPSEVRWEIKAGRFSPRIVPLWIGKQTLLLKNFDTINYNPHVQPLGDRGHNPLLPVGGVVQLDFLRPQAIPSPIGCNIHSGLRGFVLPRNNPFVAVSDADGSFKIENLPAQELEFQVWHERAGYLDIPAWPNGRFTRTIRRGENEMGTIDISPSQFHPHD